VVCPLVEARTSDGSIEGVGIEGDQLRFRTSDGDIELGAISGSIVAATSDGDISIDIERLDDTRLETDEGDIRVSVPEEAGFEFDLEGERVRVDGEERGYSRRERHRMRGEINGGGPELQATADDGTIVVRRH